MSEQIFSLYSDGGARGNPGPAACAAVLLDPAGSQVATASEYLGVNTNNFAEYRGLIAALKLALANNATQVKCHLDSELIVMQLNGAYRVKQPQLKVLFEEVQKLKEQFSHIKFVHVRRELNKEADRLVNETLDAAKASQ